MHASFPMLVSTFINSIAQRILSTDYFETTKHLVSYSHGDTKDIPCQEREPPMWPSSMIIVQKQIPDQDSKAGPATTVTYYDAKQGANLIQITPDDPQLPVLWDLELNSHHSYYFEPSQRTCKRIDFPVGILRQDFLKDATTMGESTSANGNGISCGWTKADFIDYYADKETGEPTSWYFHTMKATFQVLYYEENPTIDPSLFIPPDYC